MVAGEATRTHFFTEGRSRLEGPAQTRQSRQSRALDVKWPWDLGQNRGRRSKNRVMNEPNNRANQRQIRANQRQNHAHRRPNPAHRRQNSAHRRQNSAHRRKFRTPAVNPAHRQEPRGRSDGDTYGGRTLHRAPVGQGPPGPDWLAISFGFWSGRALATGTAWAGLCLIHHHQRHVWRLTHQVGK